MTTIKEAIAALEAADKGDVGLDMKVLKIIRELSPTYNKQFVNAIPWRVIPNPTVSLDATEKLPDGWEWTDMVKISAGYPDSGWGVLAFSGFVPPDGGTPVEVNAHHKSLPIARTIALLKIMEIENG